MTTEIQQSTPTENTKNTAEVTAPKVAEDTGRRIDVAKLEVSSQIKQKKNGERFLRRDKNTPVSKSKTENRTGKAENSTEKQETKTANKTQPKNSHRNPGKKPFAKKQQSGQKNKSRKAKTEHLSKAQIIPAAPAPEDSFTGSFADLMMEVGDVQSQQLSKGDKITAQLIQIGQKSAFFTINASQEAYMDIAEILDNKGAYTHQVGDSIEAFIIDFRGGIRLSQKLDSKSGNASMFEDALKSGIPVTGKVTGHNKGGFEVEMMGARAFCPISQIDLRFVENPEEYVGQTFDFLIREIKEGGKDVVISRRQLLENKRQKQQQATLEKLEVSSIVTGTITRLENFGAFIDLGGIDGLIPMRELAFNRVEHPKDILSIGDQATVEILSIGPDPKRENQMRISCSLKNTQASPFSIYADKLIVGNDVSGTVTKLMNFGAFVELFEKNSGLEGLIHISELSDQRVRLPEDIVTTGQEVTVKILAVDLDEKRVSLSLKNAGKEYIEAGKELEAAQSKGYARGTMINGKVGRIERYGIFFALEDGQKALLHVSETGYERNTDMSKKFTVGDEHQLMILDIDQQGKIKVSIKAIAEHEERMQLKNYQAQSRKASKSSGMGTLGDLLKDFKL